MSPIKRLSREASSNVRTSQAVATLSHCVEELVLNSLDAGATVIYIDVNAPQFCVRVSDNGSGIQEAALHEFCGTALASSRIDDIPTETERKRYYGRNGQTLYSLGSLAVLEIESRHILSSSTWRKVVRKNETLEYSCIASLTSEGITGTTVNVRDLFWCFPVRRRASNSPIEVEKVKRFLGRISLLYPRVKFTYFDSDKKAQRLRLHPCMTLRDRFATLYGEHKVAHLQDVDMSAEMNSASKIRFRGLLSGINQNGCVLGGQRTKELQLLYINSRWVKHCWEIDQTINKAYLWLQKDLERTGDGDSISGDQAEKVGHKSANLTEHQTKKVPHYPVFVLDVQCSSTEVEVIYDLERTYARFPDSLAVRKGVLQMFESLLFSSDFPSSILSSYREFTSLLLTASTFAQEAPSSLNLGRQNFLGARVPGEGETLGHAVNDANLNDRCARNFFAKRGGHVAIEPKMNETKSHLSFSRNEHVPRSKLLHQNFWEQHWSLKHLSPNDFEHTPRGEKNLEQAFFLPSRNRRLEMHRQNRTASIKCQGRSGKRDIHALQAYTTSFDMANYRSDIELRGGDADSFTCPHSCTQEYLVNMGNDKRNRHNSGYGLNSNSLFESDQENWNLTDKLGENAPDFFNSKAPNCNGTANESCCCSVSPCQTGCGSSSTSNFEYNLLNYVPEFMTAENAYLAEKNCSWSRQLRPLGLKDNLVTGSISSGDGWASSMGAANLEHPRVAGDKTSLLHEHSMPLAKILAELSSPEGDRCCSFRNSRMKPIIANILSSPTASTIVELGTYSDSGLIREFELTASTSIANLDMLSSQAKVPRPIGEKAFSDTGEIAVDDFCLRLRLDTNPDKLHRIQHGRQTSPKPRSQITAKTFVSFSSKSLSKLLVVGQVDSKFIVAVSNENLLLCFDQHAVDERCQLEKLLNFVEKSAIKIIELNPPKSWEPSPSELDVLAQHEGLLREYGFTVLVELDCLRQQDASEKRGFTVDLRESNSQALSKHCASAMLTTVPVIVGIPLSIEDLRDFLGVISARQHNGRIRPPAIRRILNSRACRSAIMFGDLLSTEQCLELMEKVALCSLPFQCAHGRPTVSPLGSLDDLQLHSCERSRSPPSLRRLSRKKSLTGGPLRNTSGKY